MIITHIVMFKLLKGANPSDVDEVFAAVQGWWIWDTYS